MACKEINNNFIIASRAYFLHPYAKYMKDIVTNKRKIPETEISTL